MKLNVAMVSLGCSKNLVDSEVMISEISSNQLQITNDIKAADVIIVNTCGFIESAKQESIDTILEMAQQKEQGRCKALIATGCLTERYRDELMKEIPELDAVLGTGDYKGIVEVIRRTVEGEKIVRYGNQENINIDQLPRVISTMGASAFLKIAEGCDNCCTYCIIPTLRGRYRSRRFEDIIGEARVLAKSGIKELNVIAQDTTRYGKDLYGEYRISELLKELTKIEGIQWIRLLYSYPDEFDEKLIETIASEEKICKYLDIPIQHASNAVLKRMARRSSKESILELIRKLRERMPDIILRTSLIVGFPGETEADFETLMAFVQEVGFNRLGVFTYSREEDTPAFRMEEQIEEAVKLARQEKIMLAQKRISGRFNKTLVGKTFEVLIEGEKSEQYFGRTYMDAPEIDGTVYFTSEKKVFPGEICCVKIKKAYEYDLVGERIDEPCK